jgi:LmbE family N-acetylglucosaminyl deacetylase
MAEKVHRGIPVAVVVATDGNSGWHSVAPRPSPDDIVEIRHNEWHRALDALGVLQANRFEFKFPDGELDDHEVELTERLCELFRRVRPLLIFAPRPGDPHVDHRTLARAVGRAVRQVYESGPESFTKPTTDRSNSNGVRMRPRVFTYRVYPGEGVWPHGRPSRIGVRALASLLFGSISTLTRQRPLLFRAPQCAATKAAAIDAYDSQRRLLGGELRYVWGKGVELYWPMTDG